MESSNYSSKRLLDINAVSRITSLGKSTIRLWESLGKFPKSIKLSQTKKVWLESDLDKWIVELNKSTNSTNNNVEGWGDGTKS